MIEIIIRTGRLKIGHDYPALVYTVETEVRRQVDFSNKTYVSRLTDGGLFQKKLPDCS